MASLPLHPESGPRLVGIARLAASGEFLREGHKVEYFTLPVRSLLNRCTVPRMPFTWTINPYRGCEFACKYCYARYTHEFMEMRNGLDFEQKIYVKQHASDLLRQELRQVKRGEEIAIGTATDPYQPAERRFEVTRGILEEFARHEGLELGMVTKSDLVLRDLDLLRTIAERNSLFVSVTITTLNVSLARLLEPRAPRPDLRLGAVRELNHAGVPAGVNCAPVLPGITDAPADLEALVRATAEAGGKHIFANPLFLKPCSAAVFLPFLEKEFPELVSSYRERYKDRAYLPKAYQQRISQLIARLRQKYGIHKGETRGDRKGELPNPEAQMTLF
ncbi:MAG: radical SAM protein [Acidobacteria bacterium]|nr:MAG: radical SAM protein [Acidobacteriota bacterium]